MPALFRRVGPSDFQDTALRANLSLVLHERSDSRSVRRAAAQIGRTRARIARLPNPERPLVIQGDPSLPFDLIVGARIGAFQHLRSALASATSTEPVPAVFVDDRAASLTAVQFFRATATLALPPDSAMRVCVASLVMRPGGKDTQLIVAGICEWPAQRTDVLRALESLIQAHVDQWFPARQLWPSPAEVLLRNEIH